MKHFLPLFAIIALTACTQTTIMDGTSFIDPGWNGVAAQSMLVEVADAPLSEQRAIETSTINVLRASGLRAEAAHTLLLPTRDYSPSQRERIINDSGYETHLVIRPYERDMVSYYTPPATRPFGSVGYGSGGFGGVGVGINFDRGYRYDEPIIKYRSDLFVIKDEHRIWTGDYSTRGVDGMSFEKVGNRFGQELVKKMQGDGVIYAPQ